MKKHIVIPLKGPVVSNPEILGGVPTIKGTRIPATLVFDLLKDGYHFSVIQKEYPSLTRRRLEAFFALMSDSFNDTQKNSTL